jgi:hypothetical protein
VGGAPSDVERLETDIRDATAVLTFLDLAPADIAETLGIRCFRWEL